jgi:hypothetical protein
MRKLLAASTGTAYRSFSTLAEAKASDSSWVVFEGDDGGQIYAVFRVSEIACSEGDLWLLLADIDARCWADDSMTHLAFEVHEEGEAISGGMGGGVADSSGWVHPSLVERSLETPIRDVLAGTHTRLRGR